MPTPLLIDALRDHLISENIVRDPRTAGTLPPCWRSPKFGAPAPGEGKGIEVGDTLTVSLFPSMGVAERPHDATWLRTDGVIVYLRAATPPDAIDTDDLIRHTLVDRRGWTMAGLQIVEAQLFRPLSLVESNEQGYDFVAEYLFQRGTL